MTLTLKQKEFCKQIVMGKDASNSYSIAFNNTNQGNCKVNASKLLKREDIQSYISDLQAQNKKIVDLANDKAADIIVEGSIATAAERMTILTKILRGELKIDTEQMTKEGAADITLTPEYNDRIRAIAELNKMDGSYAPTKQDVKLETDRPTTKIKLHDGTEIEL